MTPADDAPPFRKMSERFRGYLPVVVDVETGGFDWNRHALLEIAAIPLDLDDAGLLVPGEVASAHVVPAPGTEIDPKSLEITGIVIDHPFRFAKPEREALDHIFAAVRAGAAQARMPARDPGRPQRALRPQFPQCRGRRGSATSAIRSIPSACSTR